MPSTGTCGNGTRQRFKEELLSSRHGGACEKIPDPGTEKCTKECPIQSENTTGYFQFDVLKKKFTQIK